MQRIHSLPDSRERCERACGGAVAVLCPAQRHCDFTAMAWAAWLTLVKGSMGTADSVPSSPRRFGWLVWSSKLKP
jgi:hypothetical protein